MAYSQPAHIAQSFTVCQICEASPYLKWKCIECELLFCYNCNAKFHSKSKTLSEHHVFNIKECGTEAAMNAIHQTDLKRIHCQLHTGKKCSVFCKDCSVTICTKCIKELHKDHDFCDINEVYEEKLLKMKSYKNKVESNIEFYSQEEERLQQQMSTGQKYYKEIKENITNQENQIKNAVQIHFKKLLSEVDFHWEPNKEFLQKQLAAFSQTKKELELTKKEFSEALDSFDVSKVLTANIQVNEQPLEKARIASTDFKNYEFIKGNFSDSAIYSTFGHIYSGPKFELINTYETSTNSWISKILLVDNSSAVMARLVEDKLRKVRISDDCISVDTETSKTVYDMAMMQNGTNIIVSEKGFDLKILQLSDLSDIKTFYSFSPFITLGVHVSNNNYVLVGIVESESFITSKVNSVSRIVVLSTRGKVENVHELDTDNKKLFTRPIRIKTDSEKNIYIVDLVSISSEGRLVSINWTGNLNWIYAGNEIFENIFPRDVEITSTGSILVSDGTNHAIHHLSQDGVLIWCKTLDGLGIRSPNCLNMTENEVLWIACRSFDKNSNAKLYLLKLR